MAHIKPVAVAAGDGINQVACGEVKSLCDWKASGCAEVRDDVFRTIKVRKGCMAGERRTALTSVSFRFMFFR